MKQPGYISGKGPISSLIPIITMQTESTTACVMSPRPVPRDPGHTGTFLSIAVGFEVSRDTIRILTKEKHHKSLKIPVQGWRFPV